MKKIIGLIEYDGKNHIGIRLQINNYWEEALEDAKNVYEFTFDEDDEFVKLKKITKEQAKK